MIVSPRGSELVFVTQPDHASFAAELASLWRDPELVEHPRREELLDAIREHDNGWQEADAAPRVGAQGVPLTFQTVPPDWRREIWDRGTKRLVRTRPTAALLINEHALQLHGEESADPDPDWRDLLAAWRERRVALLEAAGLTEAELAADYRWLALFDRLSLLVCADWRDTVELGGRTASFDGAALLVKPFPLAGVTTFHIASRRLSPGRFNTDRNLAVALARQRWEKLEIKVKPAAPNAD